MVTLEVRCGACDEIFADDDLPALYRRVAKHVKTAHGVDMPPPEDDDE